MSPVAAEGGGGGGDYIVDHGTLSDVASKLGQASSAFDSSGRHVPSGGDHGLAGPLLASILAATTEVGARLAFETQTISELVTACNTNAQTVDSAQAETYLVSGKTS